MQHKNRSTLWVRWGALASVIVLGACGDTPLPTGHGADRAARSPSFALSTSPLASGYVAIDLGTLGGNSSCHLTSQIPHPSDI